MSNNILASLALTQPNPAQWWLIGGLGLIWFGGLIVWVAPWPTQFRSQAKNTTTPAEQPESAAGAFQRFWLDQYAWIGIVSASLGAVSVLIALLVGAFN